MRAPRAVVKNDKFLIQLWCNESCRVFQDKLADAAGKARFKKKLTELVDQTFGNGTFEGLGNAQFVDFLREDEYDEEAEEEDVEEEELQEDPDEEEEDSLGLYLFEPIPTTPTLAHKSDFF